MADYRSLDDATPAEWNEAQAAWRKRLTQQSDDPTFAGATDAARLDGRTVLEEAADIVGGDRQTDYGHPRDNHGATAEMWTTYLRRRYGDNVPAIDAYDVCHLNGLQKHVRDAHKRKRDNLVDIAGFAANAEMCDE